MRKEEFFTRIQPTLNIHEVTDLILKGNEFDTFIDCSTHLDHMKILDISENRLERFFFLCNDEYTLEYLNVSHNRLEYIDDNALNDRVPKLKVLDLSFNQITVVNETMLEHMKVYYSMYSIFLFYICIRYFTSNRHVITLTSADRVLFEN